MEFAVDDIDITVSLPGRDIFNAVKTESIRRIRMTFAIRTLDCHANAAGGLFVCFKPDTAGEFCCLQGLRKGDEE